jgi:hypothetical protein
VRPHELDKNAAELVRNVHDQPVLVAAEIEDQAVVADEIYRRTEPSLDIIRPCPTRL